LEGKKKIYPKISNPIRGITTKNLKKKKGKRETGR